jgi:hypothetical protein
MPEGRRCGIRPRQDIRLPERADLRLGAAKWHGSAFSAADSSRDLPVRDHHPVDPHHHHRGQQLLSLDGHALTGGSDKFALVGGWPGQQQRRCEGLQPGPRIHAPAKLRRGSIARSHAQPPDRAAERSSATSPPGQREMGARRRVWTVHGGVSTAHRPGRPCRTRHGPCCVRSPAACREAVHDMRQTTAATCARRCARRRRWPWGMPFEPIRQADGDGAGGLVSSHDGILWQRRLCPALAPSMPVWVQRPRQAGRKPVPRNRSPAGPRKRAWRLAKPLILLRLSVVERRRIELPTFALRTRRSPS